MGRRKRAIFALSRKFAVMQAFQPAPIAPTSVSAPSPKRCNSTEAEEGPAMETVEAKLLHLSAREDVEPVLHSFFSELNQFFPIFNPERVRIMLQTSTAAPRAFEMKPHGLSSISSSP
ncbi:hypothetical protein V2G26_007180 [Clonostachys chloroleuca]